MAPFSGRDSRLVRQPAQYPAGYDSSGDGNPLLLSTGHLTGATVHLIRQTDTFQHFRSPLSAFMCRKPL
jgi:hypothetical protein